MLTPLPFFPAAVMVFYTGYMAVWYWKSRPEVAAQGRKLQVMLGGLLAASIGIIVRGVRRPVLPR